MKRIIKVAVIIAALGIIAVGSYRTGASHERKVGKNSDRAYAILLPVQTDKETKANAWDAYYASKNGEELAGRLQNLNLSSDVKAALINAKATEPVVFNLFALEPIDAKLLNPGETLGATVTEDDAKYLVPPAWILQNFSARSGYTFTYAGGTYIAHCIYRSDWNGKTVLPSVVMAVVPGGGECSAVLPYIHKLIPFEAELNGDDLDFMFDTKYKAGDTVTTELHFTIVDVK